MKEVMITGLGDNVISPCKVFLDLTFILWALSNHNRVVVAIVHQ